jgi:pyrimidine-nucleoside phosphorylase
MNRKSAAGIIYSASLFLTGRKRAAKIQVNRRGELPMRATDIIRKKRDGLALDSGEIEAFAAAAANGSWPDYQLSALLMAIWLRGMSPEETTTLTAAMTRTGAVLDLSDIPGPKVDKHSTGGVGDSTSLVLAPLAAACGVIVPMMSGRGLGHSGGTLDKLEAIPGFRVNLTPDELKSALRTVGVAMIGQTATIAPADRTLYALRDAIAAVESIPLIAASIMSKKLAEGIEALVLDVKFGDGAFMKQIDDARKLAQTMVNIGKSQGVRTLALLTAMDWPLGHSAGNSLEVIECIETLKGHGPGDLRNLSLELAARMVHLAGIAGNLESARSKVCDALTSGRGLEKFRQIVANQGGDPRAIDDYKRLPLANKHQFVPANRAGFVTDMKAEAIGWAAMRLGAGRDRAEDKIDPGVGVLLRTRVGERVKVGQTVVELIGREESRMQEVAERIRDAIQIGDAPPVIPPLIREVVA